MKDNNPNQSDSPSQAVAGDREAVPVALKPCPFCDGHAALWAPTERGYPDLDFKCREPSCDQCGASLGFCNSADQAIAAWNTRPTETQSPLGGEREAPKPAQTGVLLEMVDADIARTSALESFMVRSGLLRDILIELYYYRECSSARAALSSNAGEGAKP
jgi:hypothetical protein